MTGLSGRKKNTSIKRAFLRSYQLYILGLPAIVATLIFAYGPMYGIQIAFKDYKISEGIWGSAWVGLTHFQRFIQFPNLWMMVRNTLSLTLYSLVLFPIPIILALLLNELRSQKFKKTVQMISYAPHFLSVVVVCGMVQLFLARGNGIVNNMTAALGGTMCPSCYARHILSSKIVRNHPFLKTAPWPQGQPRKPYKRCGVRMARHAARDSRPVTRRQGQRRP